MKRKLLLLALALLYLFTAAALAEETTDVNLGNVGLHFKLPFSPDKTIGTFDIPFSDAFDNEGNTFFAIFQYYAKSTDEIDALAAKLNNPDTPVEESDRLLKEFDDSVVELMTVFTLHDETQVDEMFDMWKGSSTEATSIKIGEADGYHFYLFKKDLTADLAKMDATFSAECQDIAKMLEEALKNAEFFAPVNPDEQNNGRKIEFETTDLDGNAISSKEIFAKNTITMVNIWATWCPPCKAELPELGKIHHRLEEKGCAIVGILQDSDADGAIKNAKDLLSEAKADYLNIAYPQNLDDDLVIDAFPTSFMVDSTGTILATVVGADVERYESLIDSLLEKK